MSESEMGMVERVARAISDEESGMAYMWQDHVPAARAAIEAMREPTPKMVEAALIALVTKIEEMGGPLRHVKDGEKLSDSEAAQRYMHLGSVLRTGVEVRESYRAALSAALSGEEGK